MGYGKFAFTDAAQKLRLKIFNIVFFIKVTVNHINQNVFG